MKSIRTMAAGTVLVGGALLLTAAGLSTATAQTTTASPATAAPAARHGGGLYSKLGLTSDQQASIKSILAAAKPQMQNLRAQMKANHLKLAQTKPDDPNYTSVVAEVAQSNATLSSQGTSQRAELRAQMYAVLTPAQKSQLAALEAQWAAHPHEGRWAHGSGATGAAPAAAAAQ